jgi:hypothetical protein
MNTWLSIYLIVGAVLLLIALSQAGKEDLATGLANARGISYPRARRTMWVAALVFVVFWPIGILFGLGAKK